MTSCILCFPNQLFEEKHWRALLSLVGGGGKGGCDLIVIEDSAFFGDRKGNKQNLPERLKLNQLRICYLFATIAAFVKNIQSADIFAHVHHKTFKIGETYEYLKDYKHIFAYDPMDHLLKHRLRKFNVKYSDSPSFIMTQVDIETYMESHKHKRLQHRLFFDAVKDKIDFLKGVESQDELNRKKFPRNAKVPDVPYVTLKANHLTIENLTDLFETVSKHPFFKMNSKPIHKEDAIMHLSKIPLCPQDAKQWLSKFIKERFSLFGNYEDAIVSESPYLYHSGCSIFLNNGLLTPLDMLHAIKDGNGHVGVPMQSKEAFARQVFGWREYSRLYYQMVPHGDFRQNVFDMKHGVALGKEWYNGTTGMPIVDSAIKDAFDFGYIHHIRRLMIISNYMMLNDIHPDNIYKWMYEFSMDSWDWVMIFNCYSMASWSDNGIGMRKPYISSANYVLKMSDEPRGDWEAVWNAKFREFLKKHANVLRKTPYAKLLKL